MFDEWKIKSILKKNLSNEDYKKLSLKIKSDIRVVEHFLMCSKDNINYLDKSIIFLVLEKDYSLINDLNEANLNVILNSKDIDYSKITFTKEMFEKMGAIARASLLSFSLTTYVGVCDVQEKSLIIDRMIVDISYGKDVNEEELKNIILECNNEELDKLLNGSLKCRKYVCSVLETLPLEEKTHLSIEVPKVLEYFSEDTKDDIILYSVGDNAFKANLLRVDLKVKFYQKHEELLMYADFKTIEACLTSKNNLTYYDVMKYGVERCYDTVIRNLSKEEKDKLYSSNFENVFWSFAFSRNEGKSELRKLMKEKLEKIEDPIKRDKLLNIYDSLSDDCIDPRSQWTYHNERYQISKLLFDDRIISNNDVSLIEEYVSSKDRSLLIEILVNAYGEHVREIFLERPNLDLLDIDNFKVFDKKIYDVLGVGFINYCITHELGNLNYLIYRFYEDEDILNNFKKYFDLITEGKDDLSINDITNILKKYMMFEKVISKIDFGNISDSLEDNLKLLTKDSDDFTTVVTSLEDLENYISLREVRFLEIAELLDNSSSLKNLIFEYVTGREANYRGEEDTFDRVGLEQAIKVFNIDNIVNNQEVIDKMGLTKDDVAILLLLHEINNINDVEVLKNTLTALVSRRFDHMLLSDTFDKIRAYYIKDVKDNILSSVMLDSMPKKIVDGVEIVSFEGERFDALVSVHGLNMSERLMSVCLSGEDLLHDWLNREGGFTAISSVLVSSDIDIYPVDKSTRKHIANNAVFVFGDDIEIIGMGGSDISSTHVKRKNVHSFNYMMQNENRFSSMDELKDIIKREEDHARYLGKFTSEVVIARREEDIRKSGGASKRTMPIGLYVVGEVTEELLETAKVFNKYYEEHGLGKFRIIQVNPKVYRGNGVIVESESSLGESHRR